ncbi:MAG: glyoxalase/bleomycin resistance/extradiol dioxygenase family protein [Bacteroidota bacterium]|nr:glyoxalase/bleomycin resistance/extradiol dioxygenase family protein [Bacteroidota bacterium]
MELKPYLTFNGNCEEALNFYRDCLNGEIVDKQYYENSLMQVPENYKRKILHAKINFGNNTLYMSDIMPDNKLITGNNISLSIEMTNLNYMETVFNKLSANGKVTMPIQNTFWGSKYGILRDKFGINWMFNYQTKK